MDSPIELPQMSGTCDCCGDDVLILWLVFGFNNKTFCYDCL